MAFTAKMNDFLSALVNTIALQEVYTKTYENPISRFKKGDIPLGYTGEFVHTNPATLTDYTLPTAPAFTNPFSTNNPVTFAEYLTVNEDKVANLRLSEDYLSDAMISYEKFYEFPAVLVSSLYSGNAIYEKNLMLSTALSGFGTGARTPVELALPTTQSTAEQALITVMNASDDMTDPSSKFVSPTFSTAVSWVDHSNQTILMTNKFKNALGVLARAYAFNSGELKFLAPTITVNSIGTIGGKAVNAIIMDNAALQIRDKLFRVDSIFNPADGSQNYWLRRKTMSGFLGFANAVAFVEPSST